ncbi:restriction endonuclease subunit S [Acidiphilium multivorum]|uniref:restriction endonuclease subunit S n=1 Tax=Acidiphilium multivorum TaxID=62140 RepID=UPI0039C9C1C2
MSVRQYPAYKPSGIEWVGDVPSGWAVKPLKRGARLQTVRAEARSFPVALDNIESWTGRFLETDAEFEGDGVAFQAGDLLFGKLRPYLAKAWRADRDGEAVGDFHVIRPGAEILPDYLLRLLLCREIISLIDGSTFGAKMPRASWEFVGSLPIPYPSLSEQRAIAAFLDRETAKIDALIAEQERLIALLQEKRQAVISQAVIKGLDPTVPMKDSGVEWLGQVPAHWDIVPVSRRYDVQLGRMLNESRAEGPDLRPYLRVFDVQWRNINVVDLPMMDFPEDARARYRLQPGDLLVNEGGSYVGRSAIWRADIEECYYQKALHRLRAIDKKSDTAEFFLYVMEFATRSGVFVAGGNQTTIDHLTAEQLRRYRFAFPPHVEQVQIVSALDHQMSRLGALEKESVDAILLLRERRTALISAAVTGKIDVREAVRAEPAEAA